MPENSDTPDAGGEPDKLSLVVFSGTFEKVHYALVMASAAAAVNKPVTLFFTMAAARALLADRNGAPGWHGLAREPDGPPSVERDRQFARDGVATFDELLEACLAFGVRIMVCEMGLRAMGWSRADLRADLPVEEGGVVTFLADASRDGAMLFI